MITEENAWVAISGIRGVAPKTLWELFDYLSHRQLSYDRIPSKRFILLTRDDSIRESFLNKTWSEYFDFLPLSRIYLEELARA